MPSWLLALRVAGLGWYVALCIIFGVAGGLWLDSKVDTSPLFMLLGTILGVVVAFFGIYKMVLPLLNITDDEGLNGREDKG